MLLLVGLATAYASAAPDSAPAEGIVVKNYVPAASSFKNGAALPLSPGGSPLSGTLGPSCVPETKCAQHMSTPLEFHGGSVVRDPELYLIFWGSNWTHEYEGERWKGHILNTLGGLTEEYGFNLTYQHILNQYYDSTGPIEGVKIAGAYVYEGVTAPQGQEREDIKGEVESAITQNKWIPGANSVFVVLQPPGTVYQQGFAEEKESGCGYHERDHQGDVFAFVPDLANKYFSAKCSGYSESESGPLYNRIVTFVASHEYAEAVTDPDANAWFDSEGNEIADICAEHGPILVNEALGIWMNGLWGNHEAAEKGEGEGCVVKDPPEPHPPAPTVTTGAATNLEAQSATLEGSVNPNGPDAHYYFEYGPTTSYGTKIPTPPGNDAGFGTTAVPVSAPINGLQPGTIYHYRIVASSWVGTTDGEDHTFTTTAPWLIQATLNPHGTLESDQFHGVSCWSSTACTAVGYYVNEAGIAATLVERWNGTAWEVQTTPNPAGATKVELEAVSCSSSTACTATGYYENSSGIPLTLAEHWNGTAWKVQTTPNPAGSTESRLESVSCSSSTACTAVGWYQSGSGSEVVATPLAERWNGTAWTIQSVPIPAGAGKYDTGSLRGVSCSSSIACMAVGHYEASSGSTLTLAEIWNGTAWKVQTTQNDGSNYAELEGVSCSSSTACTAVGQYKYTVSILHALTERWNGTAWEIQQTPNPNGPKETSWDLDAVSCSSATACTAVGSYGDSPGSVGPLLGERWNGTIWEIQAPSDPTGVKFSVLLGVSCTASTLCTGAGYSETYLGNDDIPSVTLAERLIIPAAETEPATEVNGSGGTLNGTVNPEGKQTSYHFEYGTTTSYGTKVPVPDANAGSGTSNIKVSQTITGLQSKTTYHFRLVATSSAGTTNGGDQTFTP